MKRIFTLSFLVALVAIFSMNMYAQHTYPTSYYKGTLAVDLTSMGMAKTNFENQYVSITPTTPGYCTVAMYNFNFGGQNLGDIVIENAQLTDGQDGGLNISGSQDNVSLAEGSIVADVSCQGTLDVNGNLNLSIDVTYSGVTIPVTFTGSYSENDGISDVTADVNADVKYYTLSGMMVPENALIHGFYVRCQGNNVSKVLIR